MKVSANQGIAAERSKELLREDKAEVGAFHITDEAGEPTFAGSLWREGKASSSHPQEGNMPETQCSDTMSTSLLRLAVLGRKHKAVLYQSQPVFDQRFAACSLHQTRKDGSTSVDGQTAADYGQALEDKLESLLARAKSEQAAATMRHRSSAATRRRMVNRRPIGIPAFEGKVLQRALVWILGKLYEPIFHPRSFGCRPGKSAHQALELLYQLLSKPGGGHVIEMDIQAFFDNLDKRLLRGFLQRRIGDGVIIRLINKWLKTGVMEAGTPCYPEQVTPQGE